ncbi:hypothetical protein BC937DRAFT_92114 [Endogone sp. FLAS-F59071]|nr:hypothetical protein BC937DRAFT_92114 [Endogone sp. FLAS-F59071]|eukprot:RUS15701.1 hypothetical protein BC937DRAFT_92114 [Endogone sp. FLAS-F59071]
MALRISSYYLHVTLCSILILPGLHFKAIRMAQDLGLHRSASKWHIPSSEAELRRRIWFGCYLIDRWTAAEMGRPMTILDYDYDTELPSAYEIQDGSLTADDVPSSSQTSFGEPIYMAFIQLIKLSEILGQVLQGLYSPRARATGLGLTDADSLVNILDRSLTNWKLALPKELRYQPGKSKEQSNLPGTAMLMLCYYTVLMLLHRPFISIDKRNQQLDFQSLSICTNAANNIIAISEEMDVHDFLSFSWTISIYTIFQSSIIHLHNASNENAHISNMAKSNLRRCIEILRVRSFVAAQKAAEILIVLINIHLAPDKISEAKKGSKEVKCASVLKHIIVNVKEDKNSPAKIEAVKDESPVTGSYLVASADSSGVDFEITVDSLSNLHNSNPKPPVQDPVFNTIQHLNEGTWEAANSVGDTQFSARPDVHLASLSPNVPSRQDSPQSSTMQQSFDNDFLVYASSGSLSPVFTFDSAQLQQQQQGNNGEVANIGLALRMDLPNPLWGIPTSINWNEWDDYITSMSH